MPYTITTEDLGDGYTRVLCTGLEGESKAIETEALRYSRDVLGGTRPVGRGDYWDGKGGYTATVEIRASVSVPTVAAALRPGMHVRYSLSDAPGIQVSGIVKAVTKPANHRVRLVIVHPDGSVLYPELEAGHPVWLNLAAMITDFHNAEYLVPLH